MRRGALPRLFVITSPAYACPIIRLTNTPPYRLSPPFPALQEKYNTDFYILYGYPVAARPFYTVSAGEGHVGLGGLAGCPVARPFDTVREGEGHVGEVFEL